MDWVSLGEVHGAFFGADAASAPPIAEVQQRTLAMIRELVSEGWFVLGMPTRKGEFERWDLPLDEAMAKIEATYLNKFEDRWSWTNMVWMDQTARGKKLALKLYHADDPEQSDEAPR
jgi:hypothetical protein